jgi:hypothetical protein
LSTGCDTTQALTVAAAAGDMDCGGGRCIMFTPRGSPFQSGGSVWRFGTTGGLRVCRKCTRHSRYPYLEEEEEEEGGREGGGRRRN